MFDQAVQTTTDASSFLEIIDYPLSNCCMYANLFWLYVMKK